jgi:hypothetical protein
MATKFMREPKEATTEPTADEAGSGMKRGGHAHKKHMAMGGNLMMAGMPMRRPMMATPALMRKKHGGEVESKAEQHREDARMSKIEKELHHHEAMKAKKAHHGLKKGGAASAVAPDNTPGGLLGGIMAQKHDSKRETGGVRSPGYKHGGKAHHISGHPEGTHKHHMAMAKHHKAKHAEGGSAHHHKMHEHHKHMAKMCKGGEMMHKAEGGLAAKGDRFQTEGTLKPKVNVQDKVVSAQKNKEHVTTKTGRVVNTVAGEKDGGFKRGGHAHNKHHYAKGGTVSEKVADRYVNSMADGVKSRYEDKKKATGDLELSKFKKGGHVKAKHHAHGGHVDHSTTHGHSDAGHTHHNKHVAKHHHGHDKIDGHSMKKGGHVGHHASKISTHKKAGGKCNY